MSEGGYVYGVESPWGLLGMSSERTDEKAESGVWRPIMFRCCSDSDSLALVELLKREGPHLRIFDTLLMQLRDLLKNRHPARRLGGEELELLTRDHLHGVPANQYGVWVYYPWSRRLVHILDEDEFAELRTNRNRYKITPEEQATLAGKRVGVIGLSVGQMVALTLALERAFGELRLADFDRVDLSNLNRIRAGVHCLNVSKAYVTAREIAEIDPYLRITVFSEGINFENAEEFLLGGGTLDVLVEECDSLDVKILIRHLARRHRIPVVMETSDRGMLDIERFDLDPGRPILHGLAEGLDPVTVSALTTEQKVPHIARLIGLQSVSTRMRASLVEVEQTISTWPQLASAVTSSAGVAANSVRQVLLGESVPSGRFFVNQEQLEARDRPASGSNVTVARGPACEDLLIRELVAQAVLAPSGGNIQPWKWVASRNEIDLLLDLERVSDIDFENGVALTALGCAAENLILAAHHAGVEVRLQLFPSGEQSLHVATFCLLRSGETAGEPHWRDDLYCQIALRHTNRKIGTRHPLAPEVLTDLTTAVRSIPMVDLQWLTSPGDLARIGELIGITDRLRLLSPTTHDELYNELRWTKQETAKGDGIDIDTLELAPLDRVGLEIMRDRQVPALVRAWGAGRKLEEPARRSIAASSAVGLVVAAKSQPSAFFTAGRAFQRLWLAATERGICVQPMTALPYFMARLKRGQGAGFDSQMVQELARLRPCWELIFHNNQDAAEAMLFRVGMGTDTDKRSLRRPLDHVLTARGER
jgi:molybdopterin/thiamine biosynthesis adenylyltransferase/nitroreductase